MAYTVDLTKMKRNSVMRIDGNYILGFNEPYAMIVAGLISPEDATFLAQGKAKPVRVECTRPEMEKDIASFIHGTHDRPVRFLRLQGSEQ